MFKFKPTPCRGYSLGLIAAGLTGILMAASLASSAIAQTPQTPQTAQAQTTPALTTAGMSFQQAMNVGYAASRQGDFNTALINFKRALMIRPGHPYAAAAADNMAYYIQYERVSARQSAIDQLYARLATATERQDWVCAATTLDQLTTYTQPGSLGRARIIGQRGEVSGLLDARFNHESWSTVCAAQGTVY